ncbi:MAG: response regulator, partial [Eggerthellaceae bacterium]|nr:response regulator [Eggerthellaceae bacterium]
VMMPVMDGLEATRKIRSSAHPEAQSMPIVALTAHAFEEDVRKTKAAGMNAHLAKPIDARDLVRVLAQYRPQPAGKAGGLGSTSEKKGALTFPAKANSAQKANPATEPSPTALEGLNILLAEDDFINMEVLRAILEDRGARVTPAENGQIAVNAFAESDSGFFDVVLMDMHMPLLDGLEATRLIRALDREDARTTPVFALTADCSDEEAQAMEAAGANGVLTKPLNVKLLAKEIAEVKSKDIAGGQA